MTLTPRVDSLLSELSLLCMQVESNAIKNSVLEALTQILKTAGEKATLVALNKVKNVIINNVYDDDESIRKVVAKLASCFTFYSEKIEITDLLYDLMSNNNNNNNNNTNDNSKNNNNNNEHWTKSAGRIITIASILQVAGQKVSFEVKEEAFLVIENGLKDEMRVNVKAAACLYIYILFLFLFNFFFFFLNYLLVVFFYLFIIICFYIVNLFFIFFKK
jgi:hypothetical protein